MFIRIMVKNSSFFFYNICFFTSPYSHKRYLNPSASSK